MATQGSLLTQASLLSPTEWRLLVAVHRHEGPATSSELGQIVPSLTLPAAEALLSRLHTRGLLRQDHPGVWGPLVPSFESLFLAQIENFFNTYVLDDPTGLRLVREVLDSYPDSQSS